MRVSRSVWAFALAAGLGCKAPASEEGPSDRSGGSQPAAHSTGGTGAVAATAGDGAAGTDGSSVAPPPPGAAGSGGTDSVMEPVAMHVVPPAPPAPEPCSVAGCPPDLICEASGVCVTAPPECVGNGDCPDGTRCGLTGECIGQGECRVRADCGEAQACRMNACVTGSDCGQTEVTIDPIQPNLLVLLDISTSMTQGLDGNACIDFGQGCPPTKMAVASQSITQMTVTYRDDMLWGLAMFPGDGGCGAPASMIAPAAGNADTVSSTVANTIPAGTTPINASIAWVQGQTALMDPTRSNYVLLLTDGAESCGGDNADTVTRLMSMASMGLKTFVVGFGGGVDADALNSFAVAGGVPQMGGSTSYYQADSAMQLEAALGSILQRVIGCDFALMAPPADPTKIWAFLDDVMIERDTSNGWALDTTTNTVSFVGESCIALQSGAVTDIDIVLGCPEPVLE